MLCCINKDTQTACDEWAEKIKQLIEASRTTIRAIMSLRAAAILERQKVN